LEPTLASGCDPLEITFSNTSVASSPMKYLWNFSDGTSSTLSNPKHIFSPPGNYNYTLTVITYSLCIDTTTFISVSSITVNPTPIASFTANPMVTSIFDPDVFFYNTSNTNNIVNWFYNLGDGSYSNSINPIHTYLNYGDYIVTQTLTNNFACTNETSLIIKILPEFRFWIPNAFTPGKKDDLNDIFKPIVIGVEDYTF